MRAKKMKFPQKDNDLKKIRTLIYSALFAVIVCSSCAQSSVSHQYHHGYGGEGGDVSTCFYDFTEVYKKRIYSVLKSAPGAHYVTKVDEYCKGDCLCYELEYEGSMESLETWLKDNLRTNKVLEFKLKRKGDRRLEAYFQGGFD